MGELQRQISLLIDWIEQREECPSWKRIRVLDTTRPDVRWEPKIRGWRITSESLVSPEDYEQRFHALSQAGYSWINLSLYGLYEDSFVVGVELPGEPVGVPPGETSINLSGPATRSDEADWRLRIELEPATSPR